MTRSIKKRPWRIDRKGFDREIYHTHVKSKDHFHVIKCLLNKGKLPKNKDLLKSAKRLLTEDEIKKFSKKKQRYINVPVKGCRTHG